MTGRSRVLVPLVACFLALTCVVAPTAGDATAPPDGSPVSAPRRPSDAPTPAAYLPPSDQSVEPALSQDFPDPDIIRSGTTWWAYATGGDEHNLMVTSSADLRHWTARAEAMPVLPRWAEGGFTWAPGVVRVGGEFLMYFSAKATITGRECISVAVSARPSGPFTDNSAGPIACQLRSAGSIDPFPFVAPDGELFLLWKSEENSYGGRSRIGGQRLSPDGRRLIGLPVRLLTATESWQGGVIEGPTMIAAAGRFYLFYGANRWDSTHAAIGYAICDSPLGPCANQSTARPWMTSHGIAWGPSGPDVFRDLSGGILIGYHAWSGATGYPTGRRALWIDTITLANGVPRLG